MGVVYMLFELPNSFIKRRLEILMEKLNVESKEKFFCNRPVGFYVWCDFGIGSGIKNKSVTIHKLCILGGLTHICCEFGFI